jgi:hypothetical protein
MRICKLDKTEQVWGKGGPAATVGLSSIGAGIGSATAAGGTPSNAGSAFVGGLAGGGVGTLVTFTTVAGGPVAIGAGVLAGAIVSNGVADSMNSYNQANPPCTPMPGINMEVTFHDPNTGKTSTVTTVAAPAETCPPGVTPSVDAMGNQTGANSNDTSDTSNSSTSSGSNDRGD